MTVHDFDNVDLSVFCYLLIDTPQRQNGSKGVLSGEPWKGSVENQTSSSHVIQNHFWF